MRILVVATKSPWPPRDGGRLALWLTLQGLADAGHTLALIAPVQPDDDIDALDDALRAVCEPTLVPSPPRRWWQAAVAALRSGEAATVARHRHAAVDAAVAHAIDTWHPDVVHAEQLQAFANCAPARRAGVPLVLRMQNVESALWQQVARARWRSRPLLIEARRLRDGERAAIAASTRTVALTDADATALRSIAGVPESHLVTIAPPFPRHLPAAPAIAGTPSLVLAGSAGWWPNRAGTGWFVATVAPALRAAFPHIAIHVHGGERVSGAGIVWHPAPDDATQAFPAGAIAVVPLHIASGIRMRILDAWARGLPVIATTTAAAGLAVEPGRDLLIADSAEAMVAALERLAHEPTLAADLIAAGRAYLARHHDASALTERLTDVYRDAIRR